MFDVILITSALEAVSGQSVASTDANSLSLFQQVASGSPPYGDDVRALSAIAALGRGPAA